jgi:hypothetical protein
VRNGPDILTAASDIRQVDIGRGNPRCGCNLQAFGRSFLRSPDTDTTRAKALIRRCQRCVTPYHLSQSWLRALRAWPCIHHLLDPAAGGRQLLSLCFTAITAVLLWLRLVAWALFAVLCFASPNNKSRPEYHSKPPPATNQLAPPLPLAPIGTFWYFRLSIVSHFASPISALPSSRQSPHNTTCCWRAT